MLPKAVMVLCVWRLVEPGLWARQMDAPASAKANAQAAPIPVRPQVSEVIDNDWIGLWNGALSFARAIAVRQ